MNKPIQWQRIALCGALLCTLFVAACSSPPRDPRRVPVEDRGTAVSAPSAAAAAGVAPPAAGAPGAGVALPSAPAPVAVAPRAGVQPAGQENAGRAGYYTVKPGDTLIRIGLDTGQNWRDIARWNQLDNPNVIEVGQVLRVTPPGAAAPLESGGVVARPIPAPAGAPVASSLPPLAGASPQPAAPAASTVASPPSTTAVTTAGTAVGAASAASAPAGAPAAPIAAARPPATAPDDDLAFIWPAAGQVVAGFDEARNKGLDIAGRAGEPVVAAADGRVVYAGAGLRGYGNLVIVKHNNTYLTAYAHNQTLLVKEDQTVRRGQKIAEMGNSDADRVKLHFEIRRQGKPVDPARYLPER